MSSATHSGMSTPRRVRPVHIAGNTADVRHAPDGSIYMRSTTAIAPYPIRITDRLEHWAAEAPDRVFLAQRRGPGPETLRNPA